MSGKGVFREGDMRGKTHLEREWHHPMCWVVDGIERERRKPAEGWLRPFSASWATGTGAAPTTGGAAPHAFPAVVDPDSPSYESHRSFPPHVGFAVCSVTDIRPTDAVTLTDMGLLTQVNSLKDLFFMCILVSS